MIEVLKQALEALETPKPLDDYPPILNAYAKTINNAITAINHFNDQDFTDTDTHQALSEVPRVIDRSSSQVCAVFFKKCNKKC